MEKIGLRKKIGLELFRKINRNNTELHELRTLFWECTLRCNLACRHCGSDCRKDSVKPDMPIADFVKVIEEITPHVNPNKTLMILSGGEVLVRDDIEKAGLYLYKKGYPWGIVTNGLFLDRKRLDSLMAAGIRTMTISLDGFEEAHNYMRGNPNSFERAVNAIKMLVEEREHIVWDIVTCANPKNFDSLPELKEFLISIGVKSWRLFSIFPTGRAAEEQELQLSDKQFKQLLDFIRDTRKEGRIDLSYGCEGFLGNYETEVRDGFYHCSAGISTASVLIDGSISGCTSIRSNFHQGNIYRDSFMDVWNNRFEKYRDRKWAKTGKCGECEMFRYCLGNGMHLRDDDGNLMLCHYEKLVNAD